MKHVRRDGRYLGVSISPWPVPGEATDTPPTPKELTDREDLAMARKRAHAALERAVIEVAMPLLSTEDQDMLDGMVGGVPE